MKKILKITWKIVLAGLILILVLAIINLRDPHKGYKADMKIIRTDSSYLGAGFAAVKITPEVPDRWIDSDGDAAYNPRKDDTFTDGNGNGKFDPVWIAGFGNKRAANGIHDDLWARTMVIDDGQTRLAIVALDLIGLMNNEIIDIRKQISPAAGITYLIVTSTHNHEAPDMLGLWGKSPFRSGINRKYTEFVKEQIVKSIETAVAGMRPARFEFSEELTGALSLVQDTRDPQVFDYGLRIIKATDRETGATLGTMIAWGNHPETLWGKNLMITSDFPHYLREYIENGIFTGDSSMVQGTGGICLYVNGAIGGLMTTPPSLTITDPVTGEKFSEPSFGKADAEGKQVAMLALKAMEKPELAIEQAGISLIVKTIILPVHNRLFRLGSTLGIFKRGTVGWMKMRSEVAVFNIGPVSFATLPGEVYPEILNGGIEAPEGRDLQIPPAEVPPVREMMKGKIRFILGLANDEIGYIIPKSQWDTRKPYAYGYDSPQYGEENSLGHETAPLLHAALKEMIEEINQDKR